jgi:dTDP-glucose pyrophosphorylase
MVYTEATVLDALKRINNLPGGLMTLFAIDGEGRLQGTVTDGDIRRALIGGAAMTDSVASVMHRDFIAVRPGDDLRSVIARGRRRKVSLLPVLEDGRITRLLDMKTLKTSLPIDAVLMAGGRGERLRPLTENVPKPLLPVGRKAIIDYNVDELEACGVENIYVTVNYLAEQIESHFAGHTGFGTVTCVREPRRLGTMGSVSLIETLRHDNVLVMNSDLLTNIDFEEMHTRHVESGADVTMASVPYSVSVPYALIRLEGERVAGLEEKPTYNYFANAGVYIIRRSLLSSLPKGEYLDAPDFISSLIAAGGRVECYPIEGTWIDIGSPDDYRYANELMNRKTN